jgi:hypothetical protein
VIEEARVRLRCSFDDLGVGTAEAELPKRRDVGAVVRREYSLGKPEVR